MQGGGYGDRRTGAAGISARAEMSAIWSRGSRRRGSEAQIAETRVIVRPAAERPVVLAIGSRDREVVDAGEPHAHEPLVVELPVLVAVGPEVLAAVVVPLVREAHGDPVSGECPELLDEPVVQLPDPFARQEGDDCRPSVQELGAVPPAAVLGVGQRDLLRIATVPGVLGEPDLLPGALGGERRNGWSRHSIVL